MTGTWEQLIRAWSEWHAATFPPRRVTGEKLQEEVRELCDLLPAPRRGLLGRIKRALGISRLRSPLGSPLVTEEGVDVIMVAIRTLELNGITPDMLLAAAWHKLEINKARTWTVVDGVERHVKEEK